MNTKKMLITYFSRKGENYAVGHIEKGNTQIIAEMIASETGGGLFHIEPVKPYPKNYDQCTSVARKELMEKARPEIQNDIQTEDYDIIFIGFPNWWGDMPMPVYTFIERHNWTGKTFIPFCTHEGSGLSDIEEKLKKACKGAAVVKGLAVHGTTAQHQQEQARQSVKNWLNPIDSSR